MFQRLFRWAYFRVGGGGIFVRGKNNRDLSEGFDCDNFVNNNKKNKNKQKTINHVLKRSFSALRFSHTKNTKGRPNKNVVNYMGVNLYIGVIIW